MLVVALAVGCLSPQATNSDVEPVAREVVVALSEAARVASSTEPFEELLKQHPESLALNRAMQDYLRGRLDTEELKARYQARVEAKPTSAAAHYLYGRTLVAEPELAEVAFRHAMELEPLNPWPPIGLAYLRSSRGDLFGTIKVYEAALENAPNSSMLRLFLGNHFLELRLYIKAERQIQHAMRLNPDNPEVWAALGKTYALLARREEATALLVRTREADPTIAHIYPTLATLYLAAREFAAADEAYATGLRYGLPHDMELASQIRAAKLVAGLE